MANSYKSLPRYAAPTIKTYLLPVVALVVVLCLLIGFALLFGGQNFDQNQRSMLTAALVGLPALALLISVWTIYSHGRKMLVGRNDAQINWQMTAPEKQRERLNQEVAGLADVLSVPPSQFSELRSAYIVAEDLALRKIESETKIPLLRHATIEKSDYDAILLDGHIIKAIDVSFIVTPEIPQEKISAILRKTEQVKKYYARVRPDTKLILLLVFVTQLDADAELKLRSAIPAALSATPVDVDIRLLDFEELQEIYAS